MRVLVFAQRAEVELLHPAPRVVEARQLVEQTRTSAPTRRRRPAPAGAQSVERGVEIRARGWLDPHRLQAVVGRAAAQGMERVVARLQDVQQRREPAAHGHPRRLLEPTHVRIEAAGSSTAKSGPGRHVGYTARVGSAAFSQPAMVPQVVGRVVRRADDGDTESRAAGPAS